MSIFGWFRKKSSAEEPPAEKPVKYSIRSRGIKLVVVLARRMGVLEQRLRIFLGKLPEELQNELARLFEDAYGLKRDFEERKAYEVENLTDLEQVVSNVDPPNCGGHNSLRLGSLQICVFHLYKDEVTRLKGLNFLKVKEVR